MGNAVMQRAGERTDQYIVLIGNIPWKVRWQDLKDLVRTITPAVERSEIYLSEDGRSRGFGYVRIRGKEEAVKVIDRLDGYVWEGRALMVKLGNEYSVCPTATVTTSGQPESPIPSSTTAMPAAPPTEASDIPFLPSQYHEANLMQQLGNHDAAPSQVAAMYQSICMQAYLHYSAISYGLSSQLEYARGQEELARAKNQWSMVTRIQQSVALRIEEQQEAQRQALTAQRLASHYLESYNSLLFIESQQQQQQQQRHPQLGQQAGNILSIPTPAFPLPPATLRASLAGMASGFAPTSFPVAPVTAMAPTGSHDPIMMAVSPSYATIAPAAMYVTPKGGLPVNLSGGAVQTESRGVFIGNLSYDCNWKDLRDYMMRAGKVTRCDVPQGANGKGKGYATVLFEKSEEANNACRLFDGEWFQGRVLRVRLDRYGNIKKGEAHSREADGSNHTIRSHRPSQASSSGGPVIVDSSVVVEAPETQAVNKPTTAIDET